VKAGDSFSAAPHCGLLDTIEEMHKVVIDRYEGHTRLDRRRFGLANCEVTQKQAWHLTRVLHI